MDKQNLIWLRKMHGALYENQLARKQKYFEEHILEIGREKSLKLSEQSSDFDENYPVDFVILWVDGNDPKWLDEKAKYYAQYYGEDDSINNASCRYRVGSFPLLVPCCR